MPRGPLPHPNPGAPPGVFRARQGDGPPEVQPNQTILHFPKKWQERYGYYRMIEPAPLSSRRGSRWISLLWHHAMGAVKRIIDTVYGRCCNHSILCGGDVVSQGM